MVMSEEKIRDSSHPYSEIACALFSYLKDRVMGQHPPSFWVYDLQKIKLKGWIWERDTTFGSCWVAVGQPDTARIGVRTHISLRGKTRAQTGWTQVVLGLNPVSVTT